MSKLTMMRGLIGSGKTTRAREIMESDGNAVRVNRDDLRSMLFSGGRWTGKKEGLTIAVEKAIVKTLLENNKHVIVDDCNMGTHHEDMWWGLCQGYRNPPLFHKEEVDTPWNECIARNMNRIGTDSFVPESQIPLMALQYGKIPQLENKEVVVVDIDGTIADCTHRVHHVRDGNKDWDKFFEGMVDDSPRIDVMDEVYKLKEEGKRIILVTARPEDYRKETTEWLRKHFDCEYDFLIMRPSGNTRPDTEVKQFIYDRYLKKYNVVKVFDDRPCVIRMWRENGLNVEDVGEGIEF
jgi:predicted kinase